jgi:hypothetical protein
MTRVGVQALSLAEWVTSLEGWVTKVSLRGIEEKRWHEPRSSHIGHDFSNPPKRLTPPQKRKPLL